MLEQKLQGLERIRRPVTINDIERMCDSLPIWMRITNDRESFVNHKALACIQQVYNNKKFGATYKA